MDLSHETIDEALRDAVRAIGGPAVVGHKLWPIKPVREAENRVNACTNPEREEKFAAAEIAWILREARQVGYHNAVNYLLADLGYRPAVPLEPEEEKGELQRQFIEAVKDSKRIAANLERLTQYPRMKSVG